jgi:predicted permease
MTTRELLSRLLHFGRRSRLDDDLNEEIRFHIETRAAELQASGVAPGPALDQARREFGSIARSMEESRAAWRFTWLEDFFADLRYATRSFRRNPGFSVTAILALALGIGANTTMFSTLESVLWRPLPVEAPEQLVRVSISLVRGGTETDVPFSFARRLRDSGVFAGLVDTGADGLSFSDGGRAERIVAEFVSADYFAVLGVKPLLGQSFSPEVRAGKWAPETVISCNFWKRRFGGDPGVIGRSIELNRVPFTIVGVSPPAFFGLVRASDYELRVPYLPEGEQLQQMEQIGAADDKWIFATARLRHGQTVLQAQQAADAVLAGFLADTRDSGTRAAGLGHVILSSQAQGDDERVAQFRRPLLLLMALVGVLLLVACSNLASVLLARSLERQREIAIRQSIGAGKGRLVRQMLAESLLLAAIGGALGVLAARVVSDWVTVFIPQGHISLTLDVHPDSRTLIFALAISILTAVLFGAIPAIQSGIADLVSALRTSGATSASRKSAQFRRLLVTAQAALCVVLLAAAGVFTRALADLRPSGYRVDPSRVLTFTMKPQPELYSNDQKRILFAEVVRRIGTIRGVQSAAIAECGPMGSRRNTATVALVGQDSIRAGLDVVSPGFFDTVGYPALTGRDFQASDTPKSMHVVIVNQSFGQLLFHERSPLGRTVELDGNRKYLVVGVASDAPYFEPSRIREPMVWTASTQEDLYMPTMHVRIESEPSAVRAAIRHELDSLDQGFPVFNARTLESRIDDSLYRERMLARLAGIFGTMALALAAFGLYGIIAYSVSQRTREIGIRRALGSSTGRVLWLVAREVLALGGTGAAAGICLTLAAERVWSSQLEGLGSLTAGVLVSCLLTLGAVAAAAIAVPAARACRVNPTVALHD